MIKRILIGIIFFITGFWAAIFNDLFFRRLIQDLFKWTTNNGIQFGGKDFYLFGNPLSFCSFGFVFLIFSIANKKERIQKTILNIAILLLIFGILLIGICTLDANLKLIECTACENGVRRLGYNEINYGLILATSALLSSIPSLILLFKNQKKS